MKGGIKVGCCQFRAVEPVIQLYFQKQCDAVDFILWVSLAEELDLEREQHPWKYTTPQV